MSPTKVLVACEFSGVLRDAFRARGHDAWSCDLLPSERPGPHMECDVRWIFGPRWDLMIAFPPCTHPTKIVDGREARVHREPPGPDRWKNRSRTLQGIADAMADQWGAYLIREQVA